MTATEYDRTVLRITSEICRQVFPVTLNTDAPGFQAGLESLRLTAEAMGRAQSAPGLWGRMRRTGLAAKAGFTFLRLYLQPARRDPPPADVRMAPSW